MQDEHERKKAFEGRMAELKQRMEAGLVVRARILRTAVERLLTGDESARKVLKHEGHKLRGVAGSYGYQALTDLAAELERRASLSPPDQLQELTNRLIERAEAVGAHGAGAESAVRPAASGSAGQPTSAPPVGTTRTTPSRVSQPSCLGAHGGSVRVLAMDDDATTLRLLGLTLKEIGGFDATVVTSARAALELLREHEFDVVISDAMMPDMNGQEFCRAARELGGHAQNVPIIILSAATKAELAWHSGLPGPVVWLQKPFMPSVLIQDVARVVQSHPLPASAPFARR